MKYILMSVFITVGLLIGCSSTDIDRKIASSDSETLDLSLQINNTLDYLKSRQLPNYSFRGAYVLDVTQDAIFLLTGRTFKKITPELEKEIIDTIFFRMDKAGRGWVGYPGGPIDLNVTGFTLMALKSAGIDENDSRVSYAWKFFKQLGGAKKFNPSIKLQLGLVGLLPLNKAFPPIPSKVLNWPATTLMQKLGVHGELLVPIFGRKVLEKLATNSLKPISKAEYLKMPLSIGRFNLGKHMIHHTNLEIAKQTIAYALQTKRYAKHWYGTLFTAANLSLFKEAQRVGLGDFSQNINESWEAFLAWRTKSEEGFMAVQLMFADIWDTASVVNALNYLPMHFVEKKKEFMPDSAAYWMVARGIPGQKAPTYSWGFDSTDVTLADTDDTAHVVHALANGPLKADPEVQKVIKGGLEWILEKQNKDGGFPAWTKGVSENLFTALTSVAGLPEMADGSQADVTSRILHSIAVVSQLNIMDNKRLKDIQTKACKFLVKNPKEVPGIDVKTYVGHWMTNYTYATSSLITGLIYGECNQYPWVKDLSLWLVEAQQNDGGWGEDNSSYVTHRYEEGRTTISQTALSLVGLMDAYELMKSKNDPDLSKLKDSIDRGVAFISKRSSQGTNYFEKDYTAVLIKAIAYNRYELLPAYSSLHVFSRWYDLNR